MISFEFFHVDVDAHVLHFTHHLYKVEGLTY